MATWAWAFFGVMVVASWVYQKLTGLLIHGLKRLGVAPTDSAAHAAASQVSAAAPLSKPLVSVLIAARNEEEHLPLLFPALLAQDYPPDRWEVWVVDDRSTDTTAALLEEWSQAHPGRIFYLRVEHCPAGISPKKHALSLALAKARGEIFVTTDADCRMHPGWLSALVGRFKPDTGLVLGLTTYAQPTQVSPWHAVMALEFSSYAFVAAALVGLGFPVHGNANNIAYRRKAHEDQAATMRHDHLNSGDDDFLLQGIHATGKWKIAYATTAESAVVTAPPEDLRHFWEQRKRWAGKCLHYQPKQVIFLATVFTYYFGIVLALIAGLANPEWLLGGLALFAWKTWSDWRVMRAATRQFGHPGLMRGFAGAAFLHIPLILAAVIAGSFGSFTWKGQKMRTRAD